MALTRSTRAKVAGLVLAGAIVPGLLVACGDDDEATTTTTAADEAGAVAAGAVEVSGAWARTSPAMAEAGAAYMVLTSAEGDRLVGAAVDPSVAGTVELHETVMAEGDMAEGDMAEGDMAEGEMAEGEMAMQPVDGIDLPAGEAVALEPGGYHIMMLDLAPPFELGQTFDLTLTFEQAGEQTVTVEVREEAP